MEQRKERRGERRRHLACVNERAYLLPDSGDAVLLTGRASGRATVLAARIVPGQIPREGCGWECQGARVAFLCRGGSRRKAEVLRAMGRQDFKLGTLLPTS